MNRPGVVFQGLRPHFPVEEREKLWNFVKEFLVLVCKNTAAARLHAAPTAAAAYGVQPGDGGAAQLRQTVRAQRPGRRRADRQRAAPAVDRQVTLSSTTALVTCTCQGRAAVTIQACIAIFCLLR